jgi:outer membrane protein assembly factor BamA
VGSFRGNRLASTGVEYVMPVFNHLDRTLGPLYLDGVYFSVFSDLGHAWNAGESSMPAASAGGEVRLRGTLMGRQPLTLRLGVARGFGADDAPGLYLTF